MATLLELAQIETNSRGSIADADPDVAAAAQLRAKIRMAITSHARTLLNGETIGAFPAAGEETNNAIGWAQRVINAPDTATDSAMRVALAGAAGSTPAQIRGIGDAAISSALAPLIPLLAKGMHPGR